MNPLMSMLGGQLPKNYTNSNISGIMQIMRTGNPQQIMQQMLSSNPKFAQTELIAAYKKEKGEPPVCMMEMWNDKHDKYIEKYAIIKHMIDLYNK